MTRLLVLWLLSEGPLHGYAIRRALRAEALGLWFQVEDTSILSMLRTLVREGFARALPSEGTGRRRRTPYRITREGRAHYRGLLLTAWRTPPAGGDALQVALAARSDLPRAAVREALVERGRALRTRIGDVVRLRRSAPTRAMARRDLARLRVDLRWTEAELVRVTPPRSSESRHA